MILIRHYNLAVRNINRNRTFTIINIAGLAVSIAAFFLMALYIENELSFDKFHKNAKNIYRVADDKFTTDLLLRSARTAGPVAPALKNDFPEIKEAVRLIQTESLVKYENRIFEERSIFYADGNVFDMFTFPFIAGNASSALANPSCVVLTEAIAKKYFGNSEPLNKLITIESKLMKVTGIIANIPANSHIQFDFLVSMSTAEQKDSGYDWLFTNWYSNAFFTYILLPDNYDVKKLFSRLNEFDERHNEANDNTTHQYILENLTDIYLRSDRDNQAGKTGSIGNLLIFSAIALFMLLIACINFINLSTARSGTRAKEVAVKKVAGASRRQLVMQFLTESYMMTALSIVTAILIVYLVLPAFNSFSERSLIPDVFHPTHFSAIVILFMVVGFFAGIYPAFALSAYKPMDALKVKVKASPLNIGIRKGLVVFQFAVSIVLIVSSLVVYNQMKYLQAYNPGFKTSQTLVINFEGDQRIKENLQFLQLELSKIPGVKNVTASSNVPGDGKVNTWSMDFARKSSDTVHTELAIYLADMNFLRQYQIPIVAGRDFSSAFANDSTSSMLINETAVKTMGFNSYNDVIGIRVGMYPEDAIIIGVFRDFNIESLQHKVQPLALRMMPSKFRLFSLEINSPDLPATIASLEKTWQKIAPERPLEYSFLDESFNRQYDSHVKFGQVFGLFTSLSIVIACLGLFGLVLFSTQQRVKEIGIRKVLGAGVANITFIVSKDFIRLVLISIFIASPVAAYFMHQWLQNFAYRINLGAGLFVAGGLITLLIALLTVSFLAMNAAKANPVDCLRSE